MSGPAEALTAVLDANVLYPRWLRDVLLTLAAVGYYGPVWSPRSAVPSPKRGSGCPTD